ncbi:23S rRNA (guanosine(2251)-2'-O)-methyltransferase RlmB [Coxiella endosymbiont of Amblyomma americanum]|uniref:23S rRNA (guanosine(2251)-2'-O)-methyltransferase RlmB n=1 Tax=Coxiella endosymbiont of Amblyomma americanum TaxID=325775 RepID=UPI000A0408B3
MIVKCANIKNQLTCNINRNFLWSSYRVHFFKRIGLYHFILYIQKTKRSQILIKEVKKSNVDIEYSRRTLNTLSVKHQKSVITKCKKNLKSFDEHTLQNIIKNRENPILLLILDEVKDPHNLGACFRSAEALGAQAIIVPKDRAVGITPTVRKVACGAVETLPFIRLTNLSRAIRWLQAEGVWIVGTTTDANSCIQDIDLTGDIAIIIGSEDKGIRCLTKKLCDFIAQIPLRGNMESLNVSVACGICLYEVERQRMLSSS